jgi:hypothetical protein
VTGSGPYRRQNLPAASGHPGDVPDRLAGEVVEEQDLHRLQAPTAGEQVDDRLPSLSEQMAEQLGGWRGLLESSVPVAVFVLVNVVLGLYPAIAGSVLTAVGIALVRLARRQPVRHAVNGLVGIAVGAFLAYRSGDAKDFYLPGILLAFGQAAVLVGSVTVGKPLVGYVWAIIAAGGKHDWLADGRLYRTFQWLTVAWAVSLIIRGGVQGLLFLADLDNLLGVARIGLSWPMYVGMVGLTVWAVRRATRHRAAAAVG